MIPRILLLIVIACEILSVTELQRQKRAYRRTPDARTGRLLRLNRISVIAGAALITLLAVYIMR